MMRRNILLMVSAAILILAGGAGVGVWMAWYNIPARIDEDAKAGIAELDEAPEKLLRQPAPLFHSFDTPFTVNMRNSNAILQANISLGTHFAATGDALGADEPAIRSAILLILADMTEEMAADEAAKKQLLQKIVVVSNDQLVRDGYGGNVDSADFTTFIIQGGGDE